MREAKGPTQGPSTQCEGGRFDLAIVRNGASHDIYRLGDLVITIPRHNELNEMTARGILKDAAAHLKGRDR